MRLGIDIGATAIKSGLVDDFYNVSERKVRPTNALNAETLLSDLEEVCRSYLKRPDITSVGIGIPGRIDTENGVLLSATNLAVQNLPLAATLSRVLDVPVYVGNDANCAMFGEVYAGAGISNPNLIMVTVGTGIGGGIRINNKIYRGRNESAGEFGHMCIHLEGVRCRCGKPGCWEAYASVTALIRQTAEAAEMNPGSLLARTVQENNSQIDGKTAFRAAKKGCPVAKELVNQYAYYLSVGINNLQKIFRPDMVVLAGAIMHEGKYLLSRIQKHIYFPENLSISKLYSQVGIIGAAILGEVYRNNEQFV